MGSPWFFFHFHSLRQTEKTGFCANLSEFMERPNADLVKKIYVPYVNAMLGIQAMYGLGLQVPHVPRKYEDPSYLHRQNHARNVVRWTVWSPVEGAEQRKIFF